MPFTTISGKIISEDFMSLCSLPSTTDISSLSSPSSISFYKGNIDSDTSPRGMSDSGFVDYICYRLPEESLDCTSCVSILRGFANGLLSTKKRLTDPEAAVLRIPDTYHCVDLSLYKDKQLVLLLNEAISTNENPGRSLLMMIETKDLAFSPLSRAMPPAFVMLQEIKESAMKFDLENGKARSIADSVMRPLAVSASRGLACVFSLRRHALVYILDEDEDGDSEVD